MRLLTSKDGDFLSNFDINVESQNGTKGSTLNQKLTDSHEEEVDGRKIGGHLTLKHVFGFCETFKKSQKIQVFI